VRPSGDLDCFGLFLLTLAKAILLNEDDDFCLRNILGIHDCNQQENDENQISSDFSTIIVIGVGESGS